MDSRIWNGSEWIEGAFGKNYKECTVECGAKQRNNRIYPKIDGVRSANKLFNIDSILVINKWWLISWIN